MDGVRASKPSKMIVVPKTSQLLPTRLEAAVAAVFPAILVFGSLYSLLSPSATMRDQSAATTATATAAPSYFALKTNLFNTVFVKRGWAWTSASLLAFAAIHPALRRGGGVRTAHLAARWLLLTAWWFAVTQWCFGPPLIDRTFRWTGGRCEAAGPHQLVTILACRAAGGSWTGGHDLSGHVFLLVLGSGMLMQEIGSVPADGTGAAFGSWRTSGALGWAYRAVWAVVGLSLWMLLMTAIYFHTWFEKVFFLFSFSCPFFPFSPFPFCPSLPFFLSISLVVSSVIVR